MWKSNQDGSGTGMSPDDAPNPLDADPGSISEEELQNNGPRGPTVVAAPVRVQSNVSFDPSATIAPRGMAGAGADKRNAFQKGPGGT